MSILIRKHSHLLLKFRQAGGMMVEVLASMLIGSLMLSGALTVMFSSSASYKTRNALADLDDRGRLALELMAQDIRRSGYKGCGNSESKPILRTFTTGSGEGWVSPELGIRGWEYANTGLGSSFNIYNLQEASFSSNDWSSNGSLDKAFSADVLRRSDVIELWPAQPYVMDITSATADSLSVGFSSSGFPENGDNNNQLLLVSDCTRNLLVKADDFGNTSVSLDSSRNNSSSDQLTGIENGHAVMLKGVLYYLRIPTNQYRSRPGLYRKEIEIDTGSKNFDDANAQEIIPSILSLQFLYGEATSDNLSVNRYVPAHQVGDWNDVVSVRIYLLAETEIENAASEAWDFTFQGNDFAPESSSDNRIRREYMKTVTLRNRSVGIALSGDE